MTPPRVFTGGPLDTNAFLVEAPGGRILFDAPQGADAAFAKESIALLVLTHGHFDHVADAAAIQKRHQCPVWGHALTAPMVTDREFFRRWGFQLEIEPVPLDALIEEGDSEWLGAAVRIFHVPGHCPGSLCTYFPGGGFLIGGDVLFAGGIGRWDLPGGNYEQLVTGIHSKLFLLPESTTVLPGHGPETTIGSEKSSNPFLQ